MDEAVAEYRQTLALEPKEDSGACYNLARALHLKGQLNEAMAEYCLVIRLKPDFAEAHCSLGGILQQLGRFEEGLASRRRGHELGSKQPGWRYPSAQWVRETVEPKVAANLNAQHRYNAACSAALAAAGQGEDAHALPDKVAAMLRRWALGWLRDDLQTYARLSQPNNPKVNQTIQQTLTHWRRDPDLNSVRDNQVLDRLPDSERTAWQALWRDVDELLTRIAKKNN